MASNNCPESDRFPVGLFVFGAVIFGVVISLLLFLITVIQKFDEIIDSHCTISDYCTNPKQYGSRFLLFTATLIGVTLAIAYVGAYNSVPAGTPVSASQIIRFVLRLVAALLFPLVGLCYVSYEESEKYDFGAFQMSVKISGWIHMIAAMFYFLVNSVLNVWDTILMIIHDSPSAGTAWTLFALSILGLLSFLGFVIVQAVLTLAPPFDRTEMRETMQQYHQVKGGSMRMNLFLPKSRKSPEMIRFEEEHRHFMRIRLLYALSFLLETVMVIVVTLTSLLVAMAKNRCLSLLR